MTRRRIATVVTVVLGLMGPAWMSRAQGPALNAEVIRSGQPEKQIQDFVNEGMKQLESTDGETLTRGRRMLIEPLKEKNVSVAFRQVFSQAAVPRLQKLADAPAHNNACNAMAVAGAIATFEAGSLLAGKLSDAEPARRRFAAAQLGELFSAIDASMPAISPLDTKTLVDKMGAAIATEQDPLTLQGLVHYLIPATAIQRESFAQLRSDAFIVLAQSIGKRAQALKGEPGDLRVLPTLLEAQLAAQAVVREVNPQRRLNDAARKQALGFQGQMLAYVVRTRGLFPVGDAEKRRNAVSIVNVAEATCAIGLQEFGVAFEAQKMADDFKAATAAGDGAFVQKALRLLTLLEAAPLNLGPFNSK